LDYGAQVLAQDQEIGRRAVPRCGRLTRGSDDLALGAGAGNRSAANLGTGRLRQRRALGATLWELAVHDQDDKLATAAANMERDFAVDRQLRLGGDRERAQIGAHQCVALCIVAHHNAGQSAADG
jgi:hypothetical protein